MRGSLFWQPDSRLTIKGFAFYQNGRFFGNGAVQVRGATDPANQFALVGGYTFNSYTPLSSLQKYQLYSGNVAYDLGGATLQSITSYGRIDVTSSNDITSFAKLLGPATSVQAVNTIINKKFSQEVRLGSDPGSTLLGARVDWLLGFFYTNERVGLGQDYGLLSFPARTRAGTVVFSSLPSRFQDVAGYADATLHFSPAFDVEAGLRVSHNTQSSQVTQGGILVGGVTTVFPEVRSRETATTFQVAPRLHLGGDAILYARVAKGYRPGGPQIPIAGGPAGLPTTFGHDSTINYETGLKGTFLDRKLTVDVAAFYIDWTDIQILTSYIVNGTSFTITGNAGKAVSKGFEWSFDLRPARGLSLGLLGSYTDAHLTRDAPILTAKSADSLPYVSDLITTVRADYEGSLGGDWTGFVGGSWSYFGHRYSDFPQHVKLPTYPSFDAQLGVRSGRYTVELYGKNLSDARGITSYLSTTAYNGTGYAGIIRPRTIGLRLTAGF